MSGRETVGQFALFLARGGETNGECEKEGKRAHAATLRQARARCKAKFAAGAASV
jgi:hypothetical protein